MSKWAIVSLSVSVLFGVLAAVSAVAGIGLVFGAPGLGVVLLVVAAVLGIFAVSSMRSYRQLGGSDRRGHQPY